MLTHHCLYDNYQYHKFLFQTTNHFRANYRV